MEPWYKVAIPRKEIREGRSFNPDEFAIHLEHVMAGTAPEDYRDPSQFFARTCFTRALREHVAMVLRRLSGQTANTAPVMTLITQFGGGKTHTLTALYHLGTRGPQAVEYPGVKEMLEHADLSTVPQARVAVFVGNAWDPQEGRETPWIDIARQLAGEEGVRALGPTARTIPPGTRTLDRVFQAANGPVLILFDEVLNFVNRYRDMAEPFHAFIQNLTVAITGTTRSAAVISLPRSQVEMTDWDMAWQEKITRVVRRVAKDLIANDETEISEVVRRRLFENLGNAGVRKSVAKAYADWCFERRAQLPPEWTAVDSAVTEDKAREFLQKRFEVCYPFHPATLSVFQRKWQALHQFQQTRGTLAMLAQWIAWAYRTGFTEARREPLITLGSAPLEVAEFRSVVLGQLGEPRLVAAIDADISGAHSHARALDVDTKGGLKDIHRRVGTAIFFESSGGQVDRVAHLPELRFAIGEPELDTTSIDNAANALEDKSYFIRRVGSDGFKIGHQPTLRKVVNDRRASLDEETEVKPAVRRLVEEEFRRSCNISLIRFPEESAAIADNPELTLVVLDPFEEWTGGGTLRARIAEWTRSRGQSPRLYPGSLVWCLKKPGRELRERVELWLAWKRVAEEVQNGTLGSDFNPRDLTEIQSKVAESKQLVQEEVWGAYRYAVIFEPSESDGLKVLDLGAGHASSHETLCARILMALRSQGLISDSVGAGYLERQWPPALKEPGAWPLSGLLQSFFNGSLVRLLDPKRTLRDKIVEFVRRGEFGLGSNRRPDGSFERVWFQEPLDPQEVLFESDVFLLTRQRAQAQKSSPPSPPAAVSSGSSGPFFDLHFPTEPQPQWTADSPPTPDTPTPSTSATTVRLVGQLPPEVWNNLGYRIIPKLRLGRNLSISVDFTVTVDSEKAKTLESEIRQILNDLGLVEKLRFDTLSTEGNP